MAAEDVLSLYNWLAENGITIWIDGGWCVDALLGEQTRRHSDLDIAVHRTNNARLRKLLESKGYKEVKRSDTSKWMYAMKNASGKEVDVHEFEYDENGKNVYGVEYPFGSLTGTGIINGQAVNCISPEWMFKFKTAYAPKEKDLQDVQTLSKKYGFELPSSHKGHHRDLHGDI